MHGRLNRLECQPSRRAFGALLVSALLGLTSAACSSSSPAAAPKPVSSTESPSPTPTPTASDIPKPGGTLRVAGVSRVLNLDPASPATEQSLSTGVATVSPGDGNDLVGRLVLRQLYGYQPIEPAEDTGSIEPDPTLLGPVPDLAGGQPKVTDGGLIATIKLRNVSWDVPSGRRVTSTDELRALKRLCLPSVHSPVAGFLSQSVVGYRVACTQLTSDPPRTLSALDAVNVPGLSIAGDSTLVIKLLRPTSDLTAILSLPETSPLPVESFVGLQVTNDPAQFVGDGPYRFVQAQSGETYALSRSPSWDPASDPLRHAYVDHVSIRGGLKAAAVTQLVAAGGADLSLDVPASSETASTATVDQLVSTYGRAAVVLAVGTKGPAAARLAVSGVRNVLAACIDAATRTRVAAALGKGIATPSDDLLTGLSVNPTGRRPLMPVPSPSPSPSASGSAAAGASSGPSASAAASAPVASATASPTPAIPPARCAPVYGVKGTNLTLLTLNTPPTRAAAAVLASRLAAAGFRVTVHAADSQQYEFFSKQGGWDLLLSDRELRYPDPRALLGPLLDPNWPGGDAISPVLSRTYTTQLLAAVAETETKAALKAWDALDTRIEESARLIPLAELSGVYPRGTNVAHAPTVPTFSNADPTNAALGSTRPGDPARSPTPTP